MHGHSVFFRVQRLGFRVQRRPKRFGMDYRCKVRLSGWPQIPLPISGFEVSGLAYYRACAVRLSKIVAGLSKQSLICKCTA